MLPCSRYSIILIVPPVTGITATGGASIFSPALSDLKHKNVILMLQLFQYKILKWKTIPIINNNTLIFYVLTSRWSNSAPSGYNNSLRSSLVPMKLIKKKKEKSFSFSWVLSTNILVFLGSLAILRLNESPNNNNNNIVVVLFVYFRSCVPVRVFISFRGLPLICKSP